MGRSEMRERTEGKRAKKRGEHREDREVKTTSA